MRRARAGRGALAVVLWGAIVIGCSEGERSSDSLVPAGDPELGIAAMRRHGCGGCHVIPGLAEARGRVGPSLAGFASRPYIAGALPNRPLDLIAWIRDPQAVHPDTLMPRLGVTAADARDMAAHLYRLR
jgi:cytochrome c2